MPSGSTTMVRYPAPFRSGTSLRNPNSEPNNPGMRTTGGPAPQSSTCRDSVAARGTLKLWRGAGSADGPPPRDPKKGPSRVGPQGGNSFYDPRPASNRGGAQAAAG